MLPSGGDQHRGGRGSQKGNNSGISPDGGSKRRKSFDLLDHSSHILNLVDAPSSMMEVMGGSEEEGGGGGADVAGGSPGETRRGSAERYGEDRALRAIEKQKKRQEEEVRQPTTSRQAAAPPADLNDSFGRLVMNDAVVPDENSAAADERSSSRRGDYPRRKPRKSRPRRGRSLDRSSELMRAANASDDDTEGAWAGTQTQQPPPPPQQTPIQRDILRRKASLELADVEATYGGIRPDPSKSELAGIGGEYDRQAQLSSRQAQSQRVLGMGRQQPREHLAAQRQGPGYAQSTRQLGAPGDAAASPAGGWGGRKYKSRRTQRRASMECGDSLGRHTRSRSADALDSMMRMSEEADSQIHEGGAHQDPSVVPHMDPNAWRSYVASELDGQQQQLNPHHASVRPATSGSAGGSSDGFNDDGSQRQRRGEPMLGVEVEMSISDGAGGPGRGDRDRRSVGSLGSTPGLGAHMAEMWADLDDEEAAHAKTLELEAQRRGGGGVVVQIVAPDEPRSAQGGGMWGSYGPGAGKHGGEGEGVLAKLKTTFTRTGRRVSASMVSAAGLADGGGGDIDIISSSHHRMAATSGHEGGGGGRSSPRAAPKRPGRNLRASNLAPRRNSHSSMDGHLIDLLDADLDYDYGDLYDDLPSSKPRGGFPGSFMLGTAAARCGDACEAIGTKRIGMVALLALSVGVAGLVASELHHRDGGNGSADATVSGVNDPARLDSLRSLLIEAGVSSEDDLSATGTAQRRALEWATLESHDAAATTDDVLVERYALATLFYSTGGAGTGDSAAPEELSEKDRRGKERRGRRLSEGADAGWLSEGGVGADEGWANSDKWLTGENVCEWYGVTCDDDAAANEGETERWSVSGLDLRKNGLNGPFPREVATGLTKLRWLGLSDNGISSTLPEEIGEMNSLVSLKLMGNEITGTVPSTLGQLSSTLQSLYLTDNLLSGELPAELGDLSSLRALALDGNELSSTIPSSLASSRLDRLEVLYLDDNALTGSIPPGFGSGTSNLTDLRLSQNGLSGSIPSDLFHSRHLEILYLDHNSLGGPVPALEGYVSSAPVLRDLQLQSNLLTGEIPKSLDWFQSLETLFLDGNELVGSIPSEMGFMKSLKRLYLSRNSLTGRIPPELARVPLPLEELVLHHNRLTGTLPGHLAKMGTLLELSVEKNELTGTVPTEFGRLTNLETFNIYGNDFVGEMPGDVCALTEEDGGKLSSLSADCAAAEGTVKCDCCHTCY